MHVGSVDRDTAAGRVWDVLHENLGRWVSGWDLTVRARTTAISTRVAEIRQQLRGTDAIYRIECTRGTGGFFYMLDRRPVTR